MGRPKGSGKKDPLEWLKATAPEWMAKIEGGDEATIRSEIAITALAEVLNQINLKEDQHVAEKKLELAEAKSQYTEATKTNKQKLSYAREILSARGAKV